jgi:hypothetical protein
MRCSMVFCPSNENENSKALPHFQKVTWVTAMPSEGASLGIHEHDVIAIVVNITTEVRI